MEALILKRKKDFSDYSVNFNSMEKQQVIELMSSSKNMSEWNKNCNTVKEAHNNSYPSWWYSEIILSGLCDRTLGAGSSEIKIVSGEEALNFFKKP